MGLKDNEDGSDKTGSTDYGEIAKAIYKMKQSHIEVNPPSINESNIDFVPKESNNTILFSLSGIAGINRDIANQIINNRPYTSFKDFYDKNSFPGTLITPSKMIVLIKAGCFDEFDPNRKNVMVEFIGYIQPDKTSLSLANLAEAKRIHAKVSTSIIAPYNFKKYVCSSNFFYKPHPKFKSKKIYWLNDRALAFFRKNCQSQLQFGVDWFEEEDKTLVIDSALDKLFKKSIENLKEYINTPSYIALFNTRSKQEKYNEIIENDNVNHWSMEATSYYSDEHELAQVDLERYNISNFSSLPESPVFETKTYGRRSWNQYEIYSICGTVLARNDNNHILTILTPEDIVVNIKFNRDAFAFYKSQISETDQDGKRVIQDKPWLKRGELLIVSGYRRGENEFVAKKYKTSIFKHLVRKINKIYDDGSIEIINNRYGYGEEEED